MKTHPLMTGPVLALLAASYVVAGAATVQAAAVPHASDAQYTILCQTFAGPTHGQDAKLAKEALTKATKLPDWYVVTSEKESNLYYGFYRSYDDPKDPDTARAQKDRRVVAALTDTAGNKPFQYCVFVPVAGADPPAPPEWDLRNAKGYFTLDIAAYMDSPLRKQYAVDAVREARKRGIEAYYYHGENASEVCVGAWPRSAVREQESSVARTTDPTEPVLVSTIPLPASMMHLRERDTGQKVKVLAPDFQPLDPDMIKMMKEFPHHSINGERAVRKYTQDGHEVELEDPSFLVLIPAKQEVVKQDPELREKAVELGIAPQPPSAPQRGEGRLRSIGQ